MLKTILGISMMVIGAVLGIYVGIWLLFIQAILILGNGIDAHTLTATIVFANLLKIFFSGYVGIFIGFIFTTIGAMFLND